MPHENHGQPMDGWNYMPPLQFGQTLPPMGASRPYGPELVHVLRCLLILPAAQYTLTSTFRVGCLQ